MCDFIHICTIKCYIIFQYKTLFLNLSTPKIEKCPKSMPKILNEKYLDFLQKYFSLILRMYSIPSSLIKTVGTHHALRAVHWVARLSIFFSTYLPWEISVITGFHYLPANKYNGDVVLHIQNNTKLNDGVMR